jgi:hypothetical protein
MTFAEQIQKQLKTLSPEKQIAVLDFIAFLQQRSGLPKTAKRLSLKNHASFGSWKNRKIDALKYQQDLRAEWDR